MLCGVEGFGVLRRAPQPDAKYRALNRELAPTMTMDFEGTVKEFPFTPPWTVLGDDVFQTFEVHTAYPSPMRPGQWPRESPGTQIRISEIFQRTATATSSTGTA